MAKRVFFTFDYAELLSGRAETVRQQCVAGSGAGVLGLFDPVAWAHALRAGDEELMRLIDAGLARTGVTCVLIGSETYRDPGVRYAIMRSFRRGNALLAVHVNHVKDRHGDMRPLAPNPLEYLGISYSQNGQSASLWELVEDEWKPYAAIDGAATYQTGGILPQYWGKGYSLSEWYPVYNWVGDRGPESFGRWIS